MNVGRWEDIHNLVYYILGKGESPWFSCAHHFAYYAKVAAYIIRSACASQFRIGSKSRLDMSWHVYLGNDSHVALSSIAHNLSCVFLSVIACYRLTVIFASVVAKCCLASHRSNLCKFRVFVDGYAPSLVFGQVPVEIVDVVHGKHVDKFLQVVHAEEVASAVDHECTIGESWSIGDVDLWKLNGYRILCNRQSFHYCLQCVEHTSMCSSLNVYELVVDVHTIAFAASSHIGNGQSYLIVALSCCSCTFDACHLLYIGSKELSVALLFLVAIGILYRCLARDYKRLSVDCLHLLWQWYYLPVAFFACGCLCAYTGKQHQSCKDLL